MKIWKIDKLINWKLKIENWKFDKLAKKCNEMKWYEGIAVLRVIEVKSIRVIVSVSVSVSISITISVSISISRFSIKF